MSGKGSNRRPQGVDDDTFSSNWERVFGARPTSDDFKYVWHEEKKDSFGNCKGFTVKFSESITADGLTGEAYLEGVKLAVDGDVVQVGVFNDSQPRNTKDTPTAFQVYVDPWPYKTEAEYVEAMKEND